MTEQYRSDPDAIRDVALGEMQPIADDIEEARLEFFRTEGDASAAFREAGISVLGSEVASYGPFSGVKERWSQFTEALSECLNISEERIQDAAEALLRIAEEYEQFDTETAGEFHSLHTAADKG
ncbi:hypothetical protein [Glycomyces harbinensis]|uniref:Excreted virulence factor EspC, type VII ESX diderm n=1 Tax=Glycomyces harbinensis TaxID=58114 RepID=A0A1G6XFM2_9ACTN|nr:hypothetical protein [Glycomyces harbinensis]SDD76125.1 hypothetical protein SAMN05216270_107110 [Glycomyces harbinensis]